MKLVFVLFSLLFITNCYTYKTQTDFNTVSFNKYVLHLKNSEKLTVENLTKKNGLYHFTVAGEQKRLSEAEVIEVKSKKFSYWKTILLVEGIGISALLLILNKMRNEIDFNFPII